MAPSLRLEARMPGRAVWCFLNFFVVIFSSKDCFRRLFQGSSYYEDLKAIRHGQVDCLMTMRNE